MGIEKTHLSNGREYFCDKVPNARCTLVKPKDQDQVRNRVSYPGNCNSS